MRSKPKAKNALTHGLYANDIVLPWEQEQDFLELHQGARVELRPVGALQDETVFEIAALHWKKRRLHIGTQLAYRAHPDAAAMATAGKEGWEGVGRYLHETSGNPDRFSDHARATANAQASAIQSVSQAIDQAMSQMSQGKGSADCAERIEQLIRLSKELTALKDTVSTMLRYSEDYDLQQGPFQRAYRPDVMEKYSKLESHIDKQIDKAFARLVRLKEYAKMYPEARVVNSPAVKLAPPLSPAVALENSEEAQRSD
jgi:hypothetical protein